MGGCTGVQQAPECQYGTFIGDTKGGESKVLRKQGITGSLVTAPDPKTTTVFELLINSFGKFASRPMIGTRVESSYSWKTYGEIRELATAFGSGILSLDLASPEDHDGLTLSFLGVYAKNREEWILADIASSMFGLCVVTFYDTLGPDSTTYILEQTNLKTVVLARATLENLLKLKKAGATGSLCNIIMMERATASEKSNAAKLGINLYDLPEIIETGNKNLREYRPPSPNDLYTICYTSGTTGNPKGVMLTHQNVVADVAGAIESFTPQPDDVHISYLPLAHIYERIVMNIMFYSGACAGFYNGDVLKLKEDFAILRPTIFPSVPRLLNRFHGIIKEQFAALSGAKARLAQTAVESKLKTLKETGVTSHPVYDMLVFKKVRDVLGGRVRISVTASAPISLEVLNFLKIAFCIPILEAYGMTESGGASTSTMSQDPSAGHVGGPVNSVEIKLVDIPEMGYTSTDIDEEYNPTPRGEVCMRGPTIFKGYFKLPEQTRDTLDSEGWLHSGDVGKILPNNSLKIIDRKKDLIKLQQGEYIAPEKIENVYVTSKYVAQAFVHGDSLQSYAIGIFVPERAVCEEWAQSKGIEEGWDELCQNDALIEEIHNDLKELGTKAKLNGIEQVKKIYLYSELLTVESGLLTPTFKLKRFNAREFFKEVISWLYSS